LLGNLGIFESHDPFASILLKFCIRCRGIQTHNTSVLDQTSFPTAWTSHCRFVTCQHLEFGDQTNAMYLHFYRLRECDCSTNAGYGLNNINSRWSIRPTHCSAQHFATYKLSCIVRHLVYTLSYTVCHIGILFKFCVVFKFFQMISTPLISKRIWMRHWNV